MKHPNKDINQVIEFSHNSFMGVNKIKIEPYVHIDSLYFGDKDHWFMVIQRGNLETTACKSSDQTLWSNIVK